MNPADDEEVLEFGRRRRRRPSAPAVTLALVAVVAAGIWLSTRGSSAPQSSALPTRSMTAPATSVPSVQQPPENMRYPWNCPAGRGCVTSRAVPARLLSTLRRYVPGARARWGYTVTRIGGSASGRALWYRRLNARAERLAVVVIVSPAGGVGRRAASTAHVVDLVSMVYVRLLVRGFVAEVQVIGPRSDRPSVRTLQRLCRDRGLTMLP